MLKAPAHLDHLVLLVTRAPPERLVSPVTLVLKALPEMFLQCPWMRKAPAVPALLVLVDHPDHLDLLALPAPADPLDHPVNVETTVEPDLKAHLVPKADPAPPDSLAALAPLETTEPAEERELLDPADHLDPLDQKDPLAHLVAMETAETMVVKVHLVLLDPPDNLDAPAPLDTRAHLLHLERMPTTAHAHAETRHKWELLVQKFDKPEIQITISYLSVLFCTFCLLNSYIR
jgi:hypothetical protein